MKVHDYRTGDTVLDSLKFADQGLRETSQERAAISEVVANSTSTSDFQESSFADETDVFFHREILV